MNAIHYTLIWNRTDQAGLLMQRMRKAEEDGVAWHFDEGKRQLWMRKYGSLREGTSAK
jgi:hypothetical protein